MKNTILSLRFAQAILATALFVLGLNKVAAQIDPIRSNLHQLSSAPGNVQDGLPGMNCLPPP
jgi:hypothetical protein